MLSLRAVHVNATVTIFCKFELGSSLHHIIAIVMQRVAVLVYLQGRHGVASLADVQIYLQNFVLLPYVRADVPGRRAVQETSTICLVLLNIDNS